MTHITDIGPNIINITNKKRITNSQDIMIGNYNKILYIIHYMHMWVLHKTKYEQYNYNNI